ncbi:MAG: biopolymer transporter ExbD [Deltaproteobacteria bacterium]|nr:biopolymer transporter ExbD [Deltaproteobacteria bacterium]
MGFHVGGGSKGVKSEINVTPLVDVVLVLLIIFLITMPILMRDISIDVPKKSEEPAPPEMALEQVVIEWKADGRMLLNGDEIRRTDLAFKLREKLEHRREKVVFVDFDDTVRYGDAVSVMDTVKGAGATTVALKMKDEGPVGAGSQAP